MSLGWIGLAEVLPFIGMSIYAGHAVDTMSKRMLSILACLSHILISGLLTLITLNIIHPDIPLIYLSIGIAGIGRSLLRPTYQSLMGKIIPKSEITRYAALSSVIMQSCIVSGPALAGLFIGWLGLTASYAISGLLAIVGLIGILICQFDDSYSNEKSNFVKSLFEGITYLKSSHIILAAMSLDMFAVLFGGATSMLPAFVKEVLSAGPEALGILRASPAIGAVIISLLLTQRPILISSGKILIFAIAGYGLSIILFGFSESFLAGSAFLFISGGFDAISVVLRTSILQLSAPPHLIGRISAINGIFISSSNEFGAFESGLAASLMGLVPSIIFGGCMTILIAIATYQFSPKLRNLNLSDLTELH
jgi:MFS family permease